eukprot:5728338-Pleurochrysis_carterae.AAC.1
MLRIEDEACRKSAAEMLTRRIRQNVSTCVISILGGAFGYLAQMAADGLRDTTREAAAVALEALVLTDCIMYAYKAGQFAPSSMGISIFPHSKFE